MQYEYTNSCTWFLRDLRTGKFLLQKRDQSDIPFPGQWTFPGGTSEAKETPLQTAKRELREELGIIDQHMEEVLTIFHHSRSIAEHFYLIEFDIDMNQLKFSEGEDWQLFDLSDIEKLDLAWWSNEVIPIIKRYMDER